MIDIVIPLGNGSYWHNNEIMYCLRGIEKYVKNYRHIYIIGNKPEWITGVQEYHRPDPFNHERNIYEKIKFACELPEISDRFLFMNDDHFLLSEIDANIYPYYYRLTLDEKISARTRPDGYRKSMENTRSILTSDRQKYFDIHTPIVYDKKLFLEVNAEVNWARPMGYVIKSLYCNKIGIDGMEMRDLKLKGPMKYGELRRKIQGRHVFSISDSAINKDFECLMSELYPNPSKYEVQKRVKSDYVKAHAL